MKKNKIGILTQPLKTNYGGLLQAFALKKVLEDNNHSVIIIDRDYKELNLLGKFKTDVKRLLLTSVLKKSKYKLTPSKKEFEIISQNTSYFINKYINPLSEKVTTDKEMERFNSLSFDAFIIGSDQVWRPKYSPSIGNYFLDFLDNKQKVKRISYAASFGVDNWEFTDNDTTVCKDLAQKFDSISVRESSGVKLCKEYLKVKAEHVLDPTMLLTSKDYIDIVEAEKEPLSKGGLMTYVLDMSLEKKELIDEVAKYLNLKAFTVMQEAKFSNPKKIEKSIFPNVTKWIKGFIDAKFVVTDSFHGTVFAIIFNKPFISIGNKARGVSRFISLLDIFNLNERLITVDFTLNKELLNKEIDWITVNEILQNKKNNSIAFLLNSLSN